MEKIILDDAALFVALNLIKRECEHHHDCQYCPLGGYDGCKISHPDILPCSFEIEFTGDNKC